MASAEGAGQHIARRQQQDGFALGRVEQRPDFRAKQKAFGRLHQIERLHPEWIARGKELARRRIDRDEGIHAGQSRNPGLPPGPKHIGDNFRVAPGTEAYAERLQFLAQIAVIVDFTVERDEKAIVERRFRLRAVRSIDNAQTARAHRGIISDHHKWVGDVASMQHARDQKLDRFFSAIPIDGNRYAAHIAPEKTDAT
jgi:hypothetical protein